MAACCKKFSDQGLILHDDSYFTLSHSSFNDNGSNYKSDASTTQPIIKFDTKAKIENKILDWIAMDLKGCLFIRKSGFAVKRQIYLNKCILYFLIAYIRIEITTAVIMSSG